MVMMAVATVALVGCKKDGGKDDPTPTPTPTPTPSVDKPEVAPTEGAVTVVWNCLNADGTPWTPKIEGQLVFAGDYNNYNTDPAELLKFEAIEGSAGWWKAVITPGEGLEGVQGKPCALYMDGTFPSSWDHQWIGIEGHPCEIVEGDATLEVEYDVESKLVVPAAGGVVYVRSYGFKADPNVEPETYTVTFTLSTIELAEGVTPYIAGAMNGWSADANPLAKKDATTWTVTLDNVVMGAEYKYVVNGTWDNNELGGEDPEHPGYYLGAGNRKVNDIDMEDEVLVWKGINGDEYKEEL